MNLVEFRTAIRTELSDATTVFSNAEIDRAVTKVVSMLSRFIPKRAVLETVLYRDIHNETLTIDSSTGTLTYKPIKEGSISMAGKTENTDFEANYLTGVITEIGALLADADYTVSYELDPKLLDISTLLPEETYLRIDRVEYPVGNNPPTYTPFEIFGEFILIKSDEDLADDSHLRIMYLKPWTAPTEATDGDYPEHLDNPLIVGACGEVLVFRAEKYVQQAVTELELSNAAADSMATPLADINTALDKVATEIGYADIAFDKVTTYLETNGTTDNAKEILADITDDIADLRTAIATALDKASTYLTNSSTPPSAHDYLIDGDDYITTINDAERVAEKYSEFAKAAMGIYQGLVAEAATRIDNIRTYIEESGAWVRIGTSFINEGMQRISSAQAYIQEAGNRISEVNAWAIQSDRYAATSREYLNIAGRYLASGQAKINEFLVSIGSKPEFLSTKVAGEQRYS